MSKQKPWIVHRGDDYIQILTAGKGEAVTGPQMYPDAQDDQQHAVMAAAPELLGALKAALLNWEEQKLDPRQTPHWVDNARATVAKAELKA